MTQEQPSFLQKVEFYNENNFHAGRLYQVEYAMEAIGHAGAALGILCTDGVVLAAEKKLVSKLLETKISSEKVLHLNWCR